LSGPDFDAVELLDLAMSCPPRPTLDTSACTPEPELTAAMLIHDQINQPWQPYRFDPVEDWVRRAGVTVRQQR